MQKKLLCLGATISILFSVLHGLFWKLGNWSAELTKLTPDNGGILQMLNVASIYTLLFSAGITLMLIKRQAFGYMEKAFLVFMAGYYLMRIAFGLPFFGFSAVEAGVWGICLLAATSYLFALRSFNNGAES